MSTNAPDCSQQPKAFRVRALWTLVGLALLAGLLACHFSLTLMRAGSLYLDTRQWIDLAAARPFQYRLLMVPVVRTLIELAGLVGSQRIGSLPPFVASPELLAHAALNAAAAFLALIGFFALVARVFAPGDPARLLSPAVFVALLYLFFCLNPNLSFILPYDIPAIAFTVLALLLWQSGRLKLLVPVFALATLNRETILLVPVAMLAGVIFTGRPRREAAWAGLLVAVWVAIKLALAWRFASLPSEEGLRIAYNLHELVRPWQWPAILPVPLLIALVARAAMRRDEGLPFAMAGLFGAAILLAVAQLTETRAFGELIPYLALALAPLLRDKLIPSRPATL